MPRRSKDADKLTGKLKNRSVKLDPSLEDFANSLSGGKSLSEGVRICIRIAYRERFEAKRLPVAFLSLLERKDPNRLATYLAKWPAGELPEGYTPTGLAHTSADQLDLESLFAEV